MTEFQGRTIEAGDQVTLTKQMVTYASAITAWAPSLDRMLENGWTIIDHIPAGTETAYDLADIRVGATIRSTQLGVTCEGVADHVTNGAWFTVEGGLLVRPGQAFEVVRG